MCCHVSMCIDVCYWHALTCVSNVCLYLAFGVESANCHWSRPVSTCCQQTKMHVICHINTRSEENSRHHIPCININEIQKAPGIFKGANYVLQHTIIILSKFKYKKKTFFFPLNWFLIGIFTEYIYCRFWWCNRVLVSSYFALIGKMPFTKLFGFKYIGYRFCRDFFCTFYVCYCTSSMWYCISPEEALTGETCCWDHYTSRIYIQIMLLIFQSEVCLWKMFLEFFFI